MLSLRRSAPVLVVAVSLTAAPVALAAAQDGAYKGTSSGKIEMRVADPVLGSTFKSVTDKGKVAFSVKRGTVKSFSLTGQKAMCGGQPLVVDIKLASLRAGKGVFKHASLGSQTVTVKLGSKGSATGTIKYGGLCAAATAKFSARIR